MNKSCDILVIGGGIIGLSTAMRLRQANLSVTLLERSLCGREASWAAAGILAPGNPHRTDSIFKMHCASLDRYPDYCAELTELTGIETQYSLCGEVKLLTTEQHVEMAKSDVRAVADKKNSDGQPLIEMLTPDQCRQIEPNVGGEMLAAVHSRLAGQVRNPRLLRALRQACDQLGVSIQEQTPVASLKLEADRVVGVNTKDGAAFSAGHTVLCAGAWTSRIEQGGIADLIPVHPVRGQVVLLQMTSPPFSHVIERRGTYLVSRSDGLVLLGATVEPEAGFEKRNTAKGVGALMADALAIAPRLADATVVAMWSGLRPATPDQRPYIGPVPGYKGLIAATGHYRSGLTLAPITAEIVRDLIVDGRCALDLSRCAPGRKPLGA